MGVPIYYGLSWIYHGLSWIIPYFMGNKVHVPNHQPAIHPVPPGSHTPPPRRSASTGSSSNVAQSHGRWRDARNPGSGTWKGGKSAGKWGKTWKLWKTWNFEEDVVVGAMILLDFLLLSIFHRGKTMVFNRNRGFFCSEILRISPAEIKQHHAASNM